MRVLIFGGSYFVGAAIAANLARQNHKVFVANRGTRPPPTPEIEQVVFDRTRPRDAALPAVDMVVDTSCYTPQDARIGLAALSAPPSRYILLSSAAVYAPPVGNSAHEEGDPTPGDPIWGDYGSEKAGAETVMQLALGSRLTVLRPPYIYGPGNNLERESFVWDRLLANRPILIPGDGSARLQFLHIDDLATIVKNLLESRSATPGVYNAAEAEYYSIVAYIECLAEVADREAAFVKMPLDIPARSYFPFRNADLVLNTRKLQSALSPAIRSLKDGLTQTFDNYKAGESSLTLTDLERALDERSL